jgi:hypothetical protein
VTRLEREITNRESDRTLTLTCLKKVIDLLGQSLEIMGVKALPLSRFQRRKERALKNYYTLS